MSAVTSRFDGREDELNANVTHFNIKTSEGQASDGNAGAPDKCVEKMLLLYRCLGRPYIARN